jgi:glyoxylase-like metal-dependent hydrolase (beta-lactamase superfamily II)
VIVHNLATGLSQAYIIETKRCLTLVDTGAPISERFILRKFKELNRFDLNLIFLTHAHIDHCGCANSLREVTGARIAIHHADRVDLAEGKTNLGYTRGRGRLIGHIFPLIEKVLNPVPTRADILLQDGDELTEYGIEGKVLYTPGHTKGSSSLLIQNKYAFVGDLLSSNGKPHVQQYFAQDWSQIPISVEMLKTINPEWVYTGHGKYPINKAALNALE